ncbi:MAG: squalene synthase HpnC [Candidatus Eiseniibacteriota bacterium]
MPELLSPTALDEVFESPDVSLPDAYRACETIVRRHYENFPVVSRFLTRARRQALAAIYAFARNADDVADAAAPTQDRLAALDRLEVALYAALDGNPTGPIFTALADTMERHALPAEPLLELLTAFRRDARDETFSTWDDLLRYCRGSANTIGRLVLALHRVDELEAIRKSDAICTALQLTNFWQDLGLDLARGRLFIPLEELRQFGLSRHDLERPESHPRLTLLLQHMCHATDALYERGRGIAAHIPFGLSLQLKLTIAGGRAILRKVERDGWHVIARRPSLGTAARARILIPALLGFDA